MNLIHTASYIQIYIISNHPSPCGDYLFINLMRHIFSNYVSPIIYSPGFNLVPEKSPYDGGFIKFL